MTEILSSSSSSLGAKKRTLDDVLGDSADLMAVEGKKDPSTGKEEKDEKEEDESIKLKTAEKKKRVKISVDKLADADGIKRVYEEFPQICQFQGRGSEAKYLRNLVERYKEWGNQLYSTFEYTDIISRTNVLSREGVMRNVVEELRLKERDRRMVEAYGVNIPKDDTPEKDSAGNDNMIGSLMDSIENSTSEMTTTKSRNEQVEEVSDSALLQAMMEFDQNNGKRTSKEGNGEKNTAEDNIELSDDESDDEEEFEAPLTTATTNTQEPQSCHNDSEKNEEVDHCSEEQKEEKEDEGVDVMESLLAMDNVDPPAS